MTKQFNAISSLAMRKMRNGFEVAEPLGAILALLYGVWLTYPTPDSASLLAVDAYSAGFLAIGSGQLIGMVQHRYGLRRVMSLLALLIWVFTALYSSEPAQFVFAAIAAWAFLRINRSGEDSTKTPKARKEPIGRGQMGDLASV
jgi:hypothetical protein